MTPYLRISFAIAFLAAISGCSSLSTRPDREDSTPEGLFSKICDAGRDNQTATGSAWIKLTSSRGGGQLPANVRATNGGMLVIELLNPFGGREGTIEYTEGKLVFDGPRFKGRRELRETEWQGIPLAWASELFLHRVPCPAKGEVSGGPEWSGEDRGKRVQVDTQRGRYTFKLKSAFDAETIEQMVFVPTAAPERSLEVNFQKRPNELQSWELKSKEGELLARWRNVDFEKGAGK